MMTAQQNLTPVANQTPAVVNVPTKELSGAQWVSRFPTSSDTADLVSPFKDDLNSFIAALRAAGVSVTVSATYRPPERAYLMHWCYKIARDNYDSRTVPDMAGVNIQWDHIAADGSYSSTGSIQSAQDMVNGYSMQNLHTPPALNSRHTLRLAVDMSISWTGNLTINKADGSTVTITTEPRTGMNTDLAAVGASYGVIKFVGGSADKPHWSDNGH